MFNSVLSQFRDPLPGFKRQWVKCRKCGKIYSYIFQPYSLSNPVTEMPCGHNYHDVNQKGWTVVNEEEAYRYFYLMDFE